MMYLIIGIVFIIVSLRMLYEGLLKKTPPSLVGNDMPGAAISKSFLGSSVGVLTGIIGLGGGYALVPAFIYFLRAPMKLAIGTSMAGFAGGLVEFSFFVLIHFNPGTCLADRYSENI